MNLDVCRNCENESCLMVMFDQKRDDGSKVAVIFNLCNFSNFANEILADRNGKRLTKYIIEKEDDSFKCIYCKGVHFSFDEDLFELFLDISLVSNGDFYLLAYFRFEFRQVE